MVSPTHPTNTVKIAQAVPLPIQHFRRRFTYDDFIRHRRRAASLWARFERSGRREDIDLAISFQEAALDVCSHSISDRATILQNLAFFYDSRYDRWGEFDDLERTIVMNRTTLELQPEGHPLRSTSLDNIALSLRKRFELQGRMEDLDESIALHRAALDVRPEGHPDHPTSLSNIASSLGMRFQQRGWMEDLEECITLHRAVLDMQPEGHPERSMALNNIASSLLMRFQQVGRMEDLEESITSYRAALDLRPEGDPGRSMILYNIANCLRKCFQQGGRMQDLEESITLHRAALDLQPKGHPHRSTSLSSIANSLLTRFELLGRLEDLEECIALHRAALDLRPKGHPNRSISLNNIANSLGTRFEQRGRIEDLEECIALHRAALNFEPEGHPRRSTTLNNIASSLSKRFHHTGRMEDLEESIALYRAALDLQPEGHQGRPMILNNIASSLLTRFEQLGWIEDLEESITLHRVALDLRPEGHPDRFMSLNNAATSLWTRFEETGNMEDLDEAITLYRAALDLQPEGHPDLSMTLNNIASSLLTRFEQGGRMEDLDESITLHHAALDLQPEGHPDRSMSLNSIALSLRARYGQRRRMEDHAAIIHSYRYSTAHSFSSFQSRIEAAHGWISFARDYDHESLPEAYSTALALLQRALTIRHTLSAQHKLLSSDARYQSLALDAASYAIDTGNLLQAIEILEQGRALLWTQLRGFRNPLQHLSRINATLAERFKACNRRLEALVAFWKPSTMDAGTGDHESRDFRASQEKRLFDEKLVEMRRLYEEQDALVKEIQGVPGFENFLRAAPFNVIQRAASEGPVIVLNYSKYRCDALIVLPRGDSPCVCVPLNKNFYDDAAELHEEFLRVRRESKVTSCEYDEVLQKVMSFLWDRVVCGVIEKLKELGIKEGSRIWWCPTSVLSAFPFHAAGPYKDANGKTKYLLDDYISSYTPTLISLIKARTGIRSGKDRVKTLFVGDTSLRSTVKERNVMIVIEDLRKHMKSLIDSDATPMAVLEWLQKVRWVHLACHGQLDEEPFESSFALPGGKLTLLDIARANLPNAEFAFLSACHTAEQGPKYALDEALHLAAAMQFCGFRSVVGTMWQLLDRDGPFLANAVYKYLMRDLVDGEIRFKRGAAAVREAALNLREHGEPDPKTGRLMTERWVNLVHIGA